MENFQIAIALFGGLAIFIYGMNLMSDGLQKAAGDRMRSVLAMLTSNPIFGVLAGALVTAVLQSSSATTVMTVGFVSAGLMKLPQAISVIMGANIGTTMTAQLIAFKVGDYAWVFVIIGFVMYFFFKNKETIRNIGQTTFGFGLLFVGINTMGATMKPLASAPFFTDLMIQVQDWPVIGVLIGTMMTVVVQSSSATIAVLQNLAATAGPDGVSSILGLSASIPILFGDNIGTTITALLACIGMSVNAKRTAVFHVVFNLTGTFIFIWWIPQIVEFISFISPKGAEIDIISRQIANTHLLFNTTNTLLFLPFLPLFVKLVTKLVPGTETVKLQSESMYLDMKMLHQPTFAIHLAIRELFRIGEFALEMINKSKKAFLEGDMKAVDEVMELEDALNKVQGETVQYLASILSAEATTETQARRVSGLMHVAADIEHVGDYCKNLVEFASDKYKNKYVFSDRAMAEINDFFDQGIWMMKDSLQALDKGDMVIANDVLIQEEQMNRTELRLREHHMKRLYDNTCSPAFTVLYNDVIHNIEKIGDSCNNIAEAVLEDTTLGQVVGTDEE